MPPKDATIEMSTLLTRDRQQGCQSTERVLLPVSRLRYADYLSQAIVDDIQLVQYT